MKPTPTTARIIGLGYKAGSGKNTVADLALQHLSGWAVALADPLKRGAGEVFGLSDAQLYGGLKETVDPFWGITPRVILQKFGTECMRANFGDDIWVRALHRRVTKLLARGNATNARVFITDVRFLNEAQAIREWGGVLVRVDRPGAGAQNGVEGHVSESELDGYSGWDAVIENNGTLADLERAVVHTFGGS